MFNLLLLSFCTLLFNFDKMLCHNISFSNYSSSLLIFFLCLSLIFSFQVCFFFVFFFSGAHGQDPVVQWSSAMAERHHRYLTEPECKGSVEQRLKEGTPVRQNRPGIEPGPPETFPARTGHLSSRAC